MTAAPLIEIRNLAVEYPVGRTMLGTRQVLRALDDINLTIRKGQFFGLVGESGSGKSTLGKALLKAAPISEGEITYHGADGNRDLTMIDKADLKAWRQKAQMIFQDPYAALSPRMTVRDIIAEPVEVMKLTESRAETDERVRAIAAKCRLNLEHLRRFPHAFSGGQRQRISIARALVSNPEFIVADESVAALDVSIQADVLNLLKSIQRELDLTFLFISHDLSVVAHTCDEVAVMYLGRIVEKAPKRELFFQPRHPYTKALLSAVPTLDTDSPAKPLELKGEIPSAANPPSGCRFHTRCPYAKPICAEQAPILAEDDAGHAVACHFWQDIA